MKPQFLLCNNIILNSNPENFGRATSTVEQIWARRHCQIWWWRCAQNIVTKLITINLTKLDYFIKIIKDKPRSSEPDDLGLALFDAIVDFWRPFNFEGLVQGLEVLVEPQTNSFQEFFESALSIGVEILSCNPVGHK